MGKKHSYLFFLFFLIPLSYVNAEDAVVIKPQSGGFHDYGYGDYLNSVMSSLGNGIRKQIDRGEAVDVKAYCSENTSECKQAKLAAHAEATAKVASEINEALDRQERMCEDLRKQKDKVLKRIQEIEDRVSNKVTLQSSAPSSSIPGQILALYQKSLSPPQDEEERKQYFEEIDQEIDALEGEARMLSAELKYLRGEGRARKGQFNLRIIERGLENCEPVKIDQSNSKLAGVIEQKTVYEDGMPLPVRAVLAKPIIEDTVVLDNSRTEIRQGVSTAEALIEKSDGVLEGTTNGFSLGGTVGIIPSIATLRESVDNIKTLGVFSAEDREGCATGFFDECSSADDSTDEGGAGSRPPRQQARADSPNDGQAYGGAPSAGSKPDDNKEQQGGGSGAMGKTSALSGFSMPSFGGMGSKTSGGAIDNSNYHVNTFSGVNVGHAPQPRNWTGDHSGSGFNVSGSRHSRNIANTAPSSGENYHPMANNNNVGGSSNASAGFVPMGNSGGNEDHKRSNSSTSSSRFNKKGNKQVFSSRDDKSGARGGATLQGKATTRDEIQSRMEQLKKERQLAGKDAFDPDKYIPKTRAEKLALARASGKLAGYVNAKSWPKDISRYREKNIFELKGYQRHLSD